VETGIVVLDGSNAAVTVFIPHHYIGRNTCRVFGVDELSRIWVNLSGEMDEIYYYYNDQWHSFSSDSVRQIISDRSGGVWLRDYNNIIHIKSDLAREETQPAAAGMPWGEIQSLYPGSDGTLWAVISYTLCSYKGSVWTDHSSVSGYPPNGGRRYDALQQHNRQV